MIEAARQLTLVTSGQCWVVALTDGADTSSRTDARAVVREFKRQGLSLVLIGVMMPGEVKAQLENNLVREIDNASGTMNAIYLDVTSPDGITEAFAQVGKIISSTNLNIESY